MQPKSILAELFYEVRSRQLCHLLGSIAVWFTPPEEEGIYILTI